MSADPTGPTGSTGPAAFLQHRPPILCIERIVEQGADWVVCLQRVVEGPHVVNGSLWEGGLIEGLSQTAGVLNGLHLQQGSEPAHRGLLVGLRDLRIHGLPQVGEAVRYRIELIRRLEPVTLMRGVACVDGRTVAEGLLKFFSEPAP